MAAAKAQFLGQSVVASRSGVVAERQGALRVVSLLGKGKKAAEKATKEVKKAAPKAAKKAAAKVNRPSNEELAKWYGEYRQFTELDLEICNVSRGEVV